MELEIVQLLLNHGADINVKGEWDDTPLHLARKAETLRPCCYCSIIERTWMPETPET